MDKIAVVTGGSKGIGRACVNALIKDGYKVIDASRTKHSLDNANYNYFKTDVASEGDVKNLFDYVAKEFGRLDVLINNAGFGKFANLAETTTKDFDEMFAVNVRGLYLCCRYALKIMIPQNSGVIINMASIAGKSSIATASIYSATKHAVMGLSGALMLEVRQHNIRVVKVCPGSVDTNFFDHPGSVLTSARESILSPEDIAEACMFAINLPDNAMVSEVELRPTNPKKK
ncbi:MAG TPA: SDR family NAD(P)-dependent oxidoreductase [Ignavibacteria bacterium]|nr:SDR family NAD(P)-dependent oxidoreductase [Ignavibacteria bacterium]